MLFIFLKHCLTVQSRSTSTLWSSCLSFLSTQITNMHHSTRQCVTFYNWIISLSIIFKVHPCVVCQNSFTFKTEQYPTTQRQHSIDSSIYWWTPGPSVAPTSWLLKTMLLWMWKHEYLFVTLLSLLLCVSRNGIPESDAFSVFHLYFNYILQKIHSFPWWQYHSMLKGFHTW